ncbi:MAG: hypothetical protein HRT61_14905 [Ekhidna sp.]|nr:hypothetical protein [Ekhidna sp.]
MNTTFLLLLFLSIPVVVHLFDFRRAKRQLFTYLPFIFSLSTKSRRKSRLKQLLILATRTALFICTCVIAILITRNVLGVGDYGRILVYFDNSYSVSRVGNEDDLKLISRQLNFRNGVFLDNYDRFSLGESDLVSGAFSVENRKIASLLAEFDRYRASDYVVFTDLQGYGKEDLLRLVEDTTRQVNIIYLVDEAVANVYVDSVYLSKSISAPGSKTITIEMSAENFEGGSVVVKLVSEGRQLGSLVMDVNDANTVSFDILESIEGNFVIEISGDNVEYDNSFLFTILKEKKPTIYLIDDSDEGLIDAVFENSELFSVTTSSSSNIDYREIENADLVVLNAIERLPLGLQSQFGSAIFVVFPADGEIDYAQYSDFFGMKITYSEEQESEIFFDQNHPLLNGVFDEFDELGPLPRFPMASNVSGDFEEIIKYRNGGSFLAKKGNLYYFNTLLKDAGGLGSDALFLPLLYQIAFSSVDKQVSLYSAPGNILELDNLSTGERVIKLVGDDFEVVPPYNYSQNRFSVEIPSDMQPGFYKLFLGDTSIRSISVNMPKSESKMDFPNVDELKELYADKKHARIIESDGSFDLAGMLEDDSKSLLNYALILALLLIFTETLLHRLFK